MPASLFDIESKDFSILFVEDDQDVAGLIKMMMEPFFADIFIASDGAEGVRLFHERQPDIILTDLMMPVMDGIEMLREIRKSSSSTPVLLMTASLDHRHLVDAINLGVSRFLPKPVERTALHQALLDIAHGLKLENIAKAARQQEMTLLRYRDRYHSQQEELARRKERHIVTNRLSSYYLPVAPCGGWIVDMINRPKDIMSGDCYSAIPSADGSMLILLADAMGYGLSASVTSMITTSFFTHIVEDCAGNPQSFDEIAKQTLRHITRILLDDEVFSCTVMQLEPNKNRARFASFGMPPMLLIRNGATDQLRSENPPISSFLDHIEIQELDLDGVTDILLSTDGMRDAPTTSGGAYKARMESDFSSTITATDLFNRFLTVINDDHDDDVTIIRLIRGGSRPNYRYQRFCVPGTLAGISELQQQIVDQLAQLGFNGEKLDHTELALSEALLNAFEHGCLNMGPNKQQLMFSGEYDDLVASAVAVPGVDITADLCTSSDEHQISAWLEITDPGQGFSDDLLRKRNINSSAAIGRGFSVMQRLVSLVRHSPRGNQLLILQTMPRRNL